MKNIYYTFIVLTLAACGRGYDNSPEGLASKFCDCSEEMGKAIVKLKAQRMTQGEFETIKREQEACMGPNDPRQSMSEGEVLNFDAAFLKAVFEKCPNTARNYGFKE